MTMQVKALRSWLHELEGLLEDYPPLMSEPKGKSVDSPIEFEAVHRPIHVRIFANPYSYRLLMTLQVKALRSSFHGAERLREEYSLRMSESREMSVDSTNKPGVVHQPIHVRIFATPYSCQLIMIVQAEAARSSLHEREGLPEENSPLTSESSEKPVDSAIKFGAVHKPIQAWSYPSAPAIPTPPSRLYAQTFHNPTVGHASAGRHLYPRHHPPHSDPHSYSRYHSRTHPVSYFPNPTGGHASAGVHLRSRHRPHSDPGYHSVTYPTQYAHDRGHPHVYPLPMRHFSQHRPSAGGGSRVANFNLSSALAHPSYSHSEPRYTYKGSILRNRGGPQPSPVVSHRF